MPKCEVCGKELPFPFECKYCGRIYCTEHRDPKDHQCPSQTIFQMQLNQEEVSGKGAVQKQQKFEEKPYFTRSAAEKEGTSRKSKHVSESGKHFKLTKWHILTSILVLVICLQAILCVNLYGENSALKSNYQNSEFQRNSLQSSYNALKADYDSLLSRYNALCSQFGILSSQYATLQSSYDALSSQYVPLENYTSLKSAYDALNLQYSSLQTSYNSLSMQYDALQASYASLQSSYNLLISQYDQLRYQINLRSQYYDVTKFVTPNDPSVQQIVTQVTGGWSNPSDWNEFWTDVKAMYDWVVNNIKYRSDGLFPVLPSSLSGSVYYTTEMWQFPNETLSLRKGDCEDMAILLCSMILYYNGGRYWTECIWITGSKSAHVGVQIPVSGGKLVILDPAGNYSTHDIWGNIISKDVSTEINNWLNYWKSDVGSDVRVYRVFADYIDKTFSSTSEYTSWMYSR